MIPSQYRSVAVTDVGVPLDEESLREHLLSRDAYRRTRFIIARHEGQLALVEIVKASETALFGRVVDVRLLAGPEETCLLERPDLDTAVPSQLVRAALGAPGMRCVVVRGRYEHVNFVLDPTSVGVHVLDVAPPWPAKLVDQVTRVLDTAEELPATTVVPEVVDLQEVVGAEPPAQRYLMPCRGGGIAVPGAEVSYLDQVPAPGEWTLVGCERSRAIHDHFYPDLAGSVRQIDICPVALAAGRPLPPGDARLTKCCLLEEHIEIRGETVLVPWGASFTLVREGLEAAAALAARRPDRGAESVTAT